jgi:hypothetical protein
MRSVCALSITPAVQDWLANTRRPKILHVFDPACNLINERREVLSIVVSQIGNGPFNLVVEDHLLFSAHLQVDSPVTVLGDQLRIGELTITMTKAKCWSPRPDWEMLHDHRENLAWQLAAFQVPDPQLPNTLRSGLSFGIVRGDISVSKLIASRLAGMGMGLTPAGDDYILGALYAASVIHPQETAVILAREIANAATPLTTSLSGAWLRSAGKGKAGIRWHEFFSALLACSPQQIRYTMDQILATGATSGADAMAGFINTFHLYTEMKNKLCIS